MRASSKVEIRYAGTHEASAVAKILSVSFAEFEPLYTPEAFSATTPSTARVLARMREGPVWIAVYDLQPVGTVAALLKSRSAYIRGMAVLPGVRGLKVGLQLLLQVEQWAAAQGCDRMFLSTTPFLSAAIALYEKSGFRRIQDPPHDLFGTPLFTMEKPIFHAKPVIP